MSIYIINRSMNFTSNSSDVCSIRFRQNGGSSFNFFIRLVVKVEVVKITKSDHAKGSVVVVVIVILKVVVLVVTVEAAVKTDAGGVF